MAAVDLLKVVQDAVFLPIKSDELPEHRKTGGLDQDLLDLPVGLQAAVRQEQHQHRPVLAAVDHHDVPHGFRLVVVLVVEHAHPPLVAAGLGEGIVPDVVQRHRVQLAAFGGKGPAVHVAPVRQGGGQGKELVKDLLHVPGPVKVEHGPGGIRAQDRRELPLRRLGEPGQGAEGGFVQRRQKLQIPLAAAGQILHPGAHPGRQRPEDLPHRWGRAAGMALPGRGGGRPGWRRRRRRVCHHAAEALHQRPETAVEASPHGAELPVSVFAVELSGHDGPLPLKLSSRVGVSDRLLPSGQQADAAAGQLPQGPGAVDGGSEGEPLDLIRQGRQVDLEPGGPGRGPLRQDHRPVRGAPLVVEQEVPLVRETAGAVQSKAGYVHGQRSLVPQLHLQGPGAADRLHGYLLSPLQFHHVFGSSPVFTCGPPPSGTQSDSGRPRPGGC